MSFHKLRYLVTDDLNELVLNDIFGKNAMQIIFACNAYKSYLNQIVIMHLHGKDLVF